MEITCTCVECGALMRPRYSEQGTPCASHSLIAMDPDYFFCTLRCAARYGVNTVRMRAGAELVNMARNPIKHAGRRALRKESERRRDQPRPSLQQRDAMRARNKALKGSKP